MKTRTKIIIAALILLAAVYFLWNSEAVKSLLGKEEEKVAGENTAVTGANIAPAPPVYDDNFPLHVGSKGPNVKYLQTALNTINSSFPFMNKYLPLVADGSFGDKTYTAVLLLAGTSYLNSNKAVTADKFNMILNKANNLKTT